MPKLIRRLLWSLVPLSALAVAGILWLQQGRVPKREHWRQATTHVREHLQPGDGVAWAPYWAGEGRLFLHDLPAFHLLDVTRADLSRWERVWLLGAFGYDAGRLPLGHELLERTRFGQLTVDLVKVGGAHVVADLRASLKDVKVSRVREGKARRCDFWDGRGWHCERRHSPAKTRKCLKKPLRKRLSDFRRRKDPHCGLNPWLHVSQDVRVIGDGPRRCVWIHPMAGQTVRLEWPEVPAGELVVDYGFTDKVITDHTRPEPRTQAAALNIRRGEAPVGAILAEPVKGWHRWQAPITGEGPLVIEVETATTTDAHLCIDATVRQERAR